MGLITLYIAVGFFFAWRFFVDMDDLKPEEMREVTKKVPLVPVIMTSMRPVVAVVFTLIWPYFAAQDVWSFIIYLPTLPSRIYTKIYSWLQIRRFRRWYDKMTDYLVFFEVESEEFFAIVSQQELTAMFMQGAPPLLPVKVYVRTVRAACSEFAREADAMKEAA